MARPRMGITTSGKRYETPIIARPVAGGFMIELTHGPEVDRSRNIVAANGCRILFHGVEHAIIGLEPVSAATGRAAFSPAQQRILRPLGRTHFVLLRETA